MITTFLHVEDGFTLCSMHSLYMSEPQVYTMTYQHIVLVSG